jgi:hypothetical protein
VPGRWRLAYTGLLMFFLYVYASLAVGTVAFNRMFPAYVALMSASLFVTVLAASSVEVPRPQTLPRRGVATFLVATASSTPMALSRVSTFARTICHTLRLGRRITVFAWPARPAGRPAPW